MVSSRIGLGDPIRPQVTVRGPASPDEVWNRYLFPTRWTSWSPQVHRVDYEPAELTPGTSGKVVGPLGLTFGFDVLSVARPSWSWRVHVGNGALVMHHGVHPARDSVDGTEATWSTEGPPWVIAYRPFVRRALQRLVSK